MPEFIRRENIALFMKRLADPRVTEPQRGALLGLLDEKMKGQGRKLAPAHPIQLCRASCDPRSGLWK